MKRRRRLLFLAPLLASSVAVTPAFAAVQPRAGEPAAVPAVGLCALIAHGPGVTVYDLQLSGFPAGQSVKVEGPRTDSRVTVDDLGEFSKPDVPYGRYAVSFKDPEKNGWQRVQCQIPPREKAGGKGNVKVTLVEIVDKTPATAVDCSKENEVVFEGKIHGAGKGKVGYYWLQFSSQDPVDPGTAEFNGQTEVVSVPRVVKVAPNSIQRDIAATLHAQNMTSEKLTVHLTCTNAKP
ncbi:hypothetical protein ABZ924_01795 [Streptomyces sp. NPDC046876]|uniref:hypothetical protein n=1 Tax=Streptomyces sp. NPDC046876 TaxID=3155616 RepID=UPI0033F83158